MQVIARTEPIRMKPKNFVLLVRLFVLFVTAHYLPTVLNVSVQTIITMLKQQLAQ
jgi:hypothetical protein